MASFLKSKIVTGLILATTLILAGVAVFTAIRLYQLRQESVAPTAPTSRPRAEESTEPSTVACSGLAFSLTTATASSTATTTATASPTDSPTDNPAGSPNACGGTCGSNTNCQQNYVCYQGFCRNPSCTSSQNCVCAPTPPPAGNSTVSPTSTTKATATAKPTVKPTAAPTQAALPDAGTSWPTVAGVGIGVILLIASLALAL